MTSLVVVPTLDEAGHIERVLDELFEGATEGSFRVLVVDGGSTDGTATIAASTGRPEVGVLHNPRRLQSAALNLALDNATPDEDVLVRIDSHSSYPPGFVERVATTLRAKACEGASSVVVPMRTEGIGRVQHAIAETQNSLLGNGGAVHRRGGCSGWIDHGHHAAMLCSALREVGGYDETMVANEDAELDERFRRAGYRIWIDGDAEITYYPRTSFSALARQYYRYGVGRATTTHRHAMKIKARQLAPLLVTVVNGAALLAATRRREALAVPAGYAAACLAIAGRQAVKQHDPALLLMAPAAAIQHHAWGAGYLRGTVRELLGR